MKFIKSKGRIGCEEISSIFKQIKSSKHNGKLITINNIEYERVGDDLLYNIKTSRIEKFG
jgi:hypothetical protein